MRISQSLQAFPYHVAGIILFFITHGYSEYPRLIPLTNLFLYFVTMLVVATAFILFFFKLTRSYRKAGLLTTYILFVYLFFGALLDSLKYSNWLHPLSRYSILLPALFLLFLGTFFLIKRSLGSFKKLTLCLNTICILIVVFDLIEIGFDLSKSGNVQREKSFSAAPCRDCEHPDIYLVVMDEYWGSSSLKTYFNYDNSQFEDFLRSSGFFVATGPVSNYMATSLSMASTFEMDYLSWTDAGRQIQVEDYSRAEKTITNSNLIKYLTDLNYEVENYSIFKIKNQPSKFNTGLLPSELELITSKTLFNRMNKDLVWHLHQKAAPRFRWLANHFQNNFKQGNQTLLALTEKSFQSKSDRPRFIYTHLMMPHYPCVYDSSGKEVEINFYDPLISKRDVDQAYLQYLVYTNKVMSTLVRNIQDKTDKKAVIILMSDHGYRGLNVKIENASSNNNFLSVYLPSGKYEKFYSSISNVNFFRSVINSLFNENFPRLKDSIVH